MTPVEEKNYDAPVYAGCDEKNTAALPKDGAHDDDMNYGVQEESGHEMTEPKNGAGIDEYKTLAAEIGGSRKSAEARKEINTNIATPLQNCKCNDTEEIDKRRTNEKEQLNCKCNDTAKIGYDQESAEALVEYDVDDRNCGDDNEKTGVADAESANSGDVADAESADLESCGEDCSDKKNVESDGEGNQNYMRSQSESESGVVAYTSRGSAVRARRGCG